MCSWSSKLSSYLNSCSAAIEPIGARGRKNKTICSSLAWPAAGWCQLVRQRIMSRRRRCWESCCSTELHRAERRNFRREQGEGLSEGARDVPHSAAAAQWRQEALLQAEGSRPECRSSHIQVIWLNTHSSSQTSNVKFQCTGHRRFSRRLTPCDSIR